MKESLHDDRDLCFVFGRNQAPARLARRKSVPAQSRAGEIGVDIEKIDPSHLDLAKGVFLPEEIAWTEQEPLSRFFTLWTLKESVMKQSGLGFAMPPKSFSVMPLLRGEGLPINGKTLYAVVTAYDRHAVAVCGEHPFSPLSIRRLNLYP